MASDNSAIPHSKLQTDNVYYNFKEYILIQYAVCILSKMHTYYFLLHLCQ